MTDHDASSSFYPYTRARTCKTPIADDASSRVMRHAAVADAPRCLIPFDRREGMTTAEAAARADRTERTIRMWCRDHDVGRRIAGGPWLVSRVALAMFLSDDADALRAYLAGERRTPAVAAYFLAEGLGDMVQV